MESYLLLFSLGAIALKLTLLVLRPKAIINADRWLLCFFVGLLLANAVEALVIAMLDMPGVMVVMVKAYYLACGLSLLGVTVYSVSLVANSFKWTKPITLALFAIYCGVVLFPGAGLAGVEKLGFSYTRIPGDYYPFIPLILFAGLATVALSLWRAHRGASSSGRRKAMTLALSCLPLVVASVVVIGLMVFGFRINATFIISGASIITLWVLVLVDSNKRQETLLTYIPGSRENKLAMKMVAIFQAQSGGLDQSIKDIKSELIDYILEEEGDNKSKAAKRLGISRQTLYRYAAEKNNKP